MRIGIMGGTFDPIHNGHLMLGEYAYQQFHLDEVWYMPNGNPPHKSNPEIRKDLQDRAEMTRLAIEEIPYFRLCTYEMDRKETSYSYQTMEYFKETYPQDEFYFIIGADSLGYLGIDRLSEMVEGLPICKGCFTGQYPMEPPKEDIRGEYYDKEIDLERKMSRS